MYVIIHKPVLNQVLMIYLIYQFNVCNMIAPTNFVGEAKVIVIMCHSICKRSSNLLKQGCDTSKCKCCQVHSVTWKTRYQWQLSWQMPRDWHSAETPCVLALALKCCDSLGALAVISKVFRTVWAMLAWFQRIAFLGNIFGNHGVLPLLLLFVIFIRYTRDAISLLCWSYVFTAGFLASNCLGCLAKSSKSNSGVVAVLGCPSDDGYKSDPRWRPQIIKWGTRSLKCRKHTLIIII